MDWFDSNLPAIGLVFAGSYLNHINALVYHPDYREQLLVDLLHSYLTSELENLSSKQMYNLFTLTQLSAVHKLLELWSEDLKFIYKIRESQNSEFIEQLAQRFLQRVLTLETCTIIPNGLILAERTQMDEDKYFENVSLAILTKEGSRINWIQVDPGSAYHQLCKHVVGQKSNVYLEITAINPRNITEEWLSLLIGLKAILCKVPYYKDVSLYECLLSHLNGETTFKSEPDEGFIMFSHDSPAHTWHVVDHSFRYFLRHFLGVDYQMVYRYLITNFKLFLMDKTLAAYESGITRQMQYCHFLLQEMCREVAQQALDQGNEEQKQFSFQLIVKAKAAIEKLCRQQEKLKSGKSQLRVARVLSLSFVPPHVNNHTCLLMRADGFDLQIDPVFMKPSMEDDINKYLAKFKLNFIDKLIDATDINRTALLSYGIEAFFIDYLADTNILDRSVNSSFSRDDSHLANNLKNLAEIYYGCQSRLVNNFLSNLTYEPQFYAKNVTIQFFVYAAIAALNYRDPSIGPLLAKYNLSVYTSTSLTLHKIIPQLVIDDCRWSNVLLTVQAFFIPKNCDGTLFSGGEFSFAVYNDADTKDTNVNFAYQLLKKYPSMYNRFTDAYLGIEDEKLNHKWSTLTYEPYYLPRLYFLLSKIAYFAKVSLTGFPSIAKSNCISAHWSVTKTAHSTWSEVTKSYGPPYFYRSKVKFQVNDFSVTGHPYHDVLTSYAIKSGYTSSKNSYQRFITCEEDKKTDKKIHFLENEIIATQGMKPEAMSCNRYMHLGFLQSKPLLKLQRLFIALKEKQLDFTCEQEGILMKQTLFEISIVLQSAGKTCSLLEWTAKDNPSLIHAIGLLCIEKAKSMQYRLTQHHVIGDLLSVVLGLLTFYPAIYKDTFVEGILDIYRLLKENLTTPPAYLRNNTLMHLNAYLLIAAQAKPQILETDTLSVLKALVNIQILKLKGSKLNNSLLLQVNLAIFTLCSWVEYQLMHDPTLLNNLMLIVNPQWDQACSWSKSANGLLFTCGKYTIKPLEGYIYFQNRPILGLPDIITGHRTFKEYLGNVTFPVRASVCEMKGKELPCFESVDQNPQLRLTLVEQALHIEEWIDNGYQRYISAQELLRHHNDCSLLSESPNDNGKLLHWLHNDENLLIKDKQRQIIFQWDLKNNFVFSVQHNGYLVPWKHLRHSYFKMWLQQIESPTWIELIAQPSSASSNISVQSLNFPRLGLNFDYKNGKFSSKQVHGFFIAAQQYLNTLHSFSNYVVLEKNEQNAVQERIKVIIPHRKVTSVRPFCAKTATADCSNVLSPAFFVYDYDMKMGLLRGHNIRAHLYLALLYFRSASLDVHDESHCNSYHLARQNLELCWKEQPYDNIELDIIEQLLNVSAMRSLHSHLVAIYLKVVSLLSSSLKLAFLYMDKPAQQNKKRSEQLLEQHDVSLSYLQLIYFQNKSTILARIRLSTEEEKDVERNCLTPYPTNKEKCYNKHYRRFFAEERTDFVNIFMKYLPYFKFSYDTVELDFSCINGILTDRFRLVHFIFLYELAKASSVPLLKYRYLLHHLMIRSQINYETFPAELQNMLARALLLVAENPAEFPNSPNWFLNGFSVDLSSRKVQKSFVLQQLSSFLTQNLTRYTRRKAIEEMMKKDKKDNEQIWFLFEKYHLDAQGLPCCLPKDPECFTLCYENYYDWFDDYHKQNMVRKVYLQAAYNDVIYQFFYTVFKRCNELKHGPKVGWTVAPFTYNFIEVSPFVNEEHCLPTPEQASLEKWAIPQQPLIDLHDFFAINSQPAKNSDFLFESHLEELKNGYQHQFYTELKASWLAYTNEEKYSYSWQSSQSINELEAVLRTKYNEFHMQAAQIWAKIADQFKERSNCQSNDYFALQWHSGQVRHYDKGDILKLLIEPHKLSNYNPDCLSKSDSIIQDLLNYVTDEIHSMKIVRALGLIEQYKQAETEPEQFSVLQGIVRCLQENLDPESYRHPHWFLFQFENEIIVRDNQRELITAMLNQSEKAMYQLNMGEGKSSVILPLLSYNLANGKQLLRINVLSALLTTMQAFLHQCFSGLIQKRVYALPFSRDTDISTDHLRLILEALQMCRNVGHILLVTPEHRLCLQLKIRDLMLENQQQIGAANVFNWQTYRQRAHSKTDVYKDLNESQTKQLLTKQDQSLRNFLCSKGYIDSNDRILKVPPCGQDLKEFFQFKVRYDFCFKEWTCLKAAYRELLYNSTHAYNDCCRKLALLNEIAAITAIDLLDESDEILRHGTELNYTIGDKYQFAGGELRWQIPQFFIKTIFCDSDLRKIITTGKADGFTTINLHFSSKGGVPFVQLLNESYFENCIKPLLISKFFQENLPTLRKYHCSEDSPLIQGEKSSLRDYISGQLPLSTERKLVDFLRDKGTLKDKVLIAKGWLSHGILFHVFNAKYRVRYGLNLNAQVPKQIAVPFFGKDTPSLRSEFSHPDVMLGFTIISYLYEGLDEEQLKKTLNKVRSKYSLQLADLHLRTWTEAGQDWIKSQTTEHQFPPLLLSSLQHLDLENKLCLEQVHQYLSGNYLAIFFYLNQFLLLEEAMQYLYKISANAHSLVGYDAALGFSGTDDRKITMPFQIKSLRSKTQEGTNGKLLSVLTQERNCNYYSVEMEDTVDLLKKLCCYASKQPNCHALIDAGALVTGLTNYAVADFLLDHLPSRLLGVLYFSDDTNSLTVLTRDKKTTAFQDCYLDKQYLFAYLDDIHTRGTDIKLPLSCHAILTIGMEMEKDKLMQAAMRLRQLAQKQSVSLWGTQAVTFAISRDNPIDVASINSVEVIKWVTRNTINHINADLFPVAVRKINFQFLRKAEMWLKEAPTTLNTLVQCCQEKEIFWLEEFYALSPQSEDLAKRLEYFVCTCLKTFWQELEQELQSKQLIGTDYHEKVFNELDRNTFEELLSANCEELLPYLQLGRVHNSLDSDQENEAEAEVEVQVEVIQEQTVISKSENQTAKIETPWDAKLILEKNFITVAKQNNIIMPLNAIKTFIQVPVLKNIIWHANIYMTTNFILSIECSGDETLDNYLRPVDVVLMHRFGMKSKAVLLSGQEAARIKLMSHNKFDHNLMIHINDINGPTQVPVGSSVTGEEQKLLTIVKLFSGQCHYSTLKEVHRIAKRVGRIYPSYLTCLGISNDLSDKLFDVLIKEGFLDFSGIMTGKLLNVLYRVKLKEPLSLNLPDKYRKYDKRLLKKLHGILSKLIIHVSCPLKNNHNILRQWVGTRGYLKEYHGSALESILNPEYEPRCSH